MAFKVHCQIDGLKELIGRLTGLKMKMRNKILRTATTKAARLIAKKAKQKCPVRMTGGQVARQAKRLRKEGIAAPPKIAAASNITPLKLLKKSIGQKVKTYKSGVVVGIVGPRKGFRAEIGKRVRKGKKSNVGDPIYADPVNYAHLVELGTKHSKAQPFLRPALEESKDEIRAIFAEEIRAGLAAASVR